MACEFCPVSNNTLTMSLEAKTLRLDICSNPDATCARLLNDVRDTLEVREDAFMTFEWGRHGILPFEELGKGDIIEIFPLSYPSQTNGNFIQSSFLRASILDSLTTQEEQELTPDGSVIPFASRYLTAQVYSHTDVGPQPTRPNNAPQIKSDTKITIHGAYDEKTKDYFPGVLHRGRGIAYKMDDAEESYLYTCPIQEILIARYANPQDLDKSPSLSVLVFSSGFSKPAKPPTIRRPQGFSVKMNI